VSYPGQQHTVFIGIGSNVGDRYAQILAALRALGSIMVIARQSSIYETEPLGYTGQGWFLNMVVEGRCAHQPQELLAELKAIEAAMGRKPAVRNGPRCIDLDILLFDDLVVCEDRLTVPHPGIPHRRFVLVPLCEIAPGLVHPSLGMSVRQLLDSLSSAARVNLWSPERSAC